MRNLSLSLGYTYLAQNWDGYSLVDLGKKLVVSPVLEC